MTEEAEVYSKLLANSELFDAYCAPKTLKILSQISVLAHLKPYQNSTLYTNLKAHDGEALKNTDPSCSVPASGGSGLG